MERGLISREHK